MKLTQRDLVLGAIILILVVFILYNISTSPSNPLQLLTLTTSTPGAATSTNTSTPTSTPVTVGPGSTPQTPPSIPAPPPIINKPFAYSFNTPGTLYEAGNAGGTTSPFWWVDSGSRLIIENGVGHTIAGSLPANDPWRVVYARSNPVDTDQGTHPQNIFRLVTKGSWTNYTEEIYFKITGNNFSTSPNRNESNGLLLFNRYRDSANLYYTGVRVDGNAVIKKKIGGTYYTMSIDPLFAGIYNRSSSPNLLPFNTWIGLRATVTDVANGGVSIKLYMDVGKTGHWILAAQATDTGNQYGGTPIAGPAHLGVRTDFMDVQFANFKVTPL